jgi:hypothetical protein
MRSAAILVAFALSLSSSAFAQKEPGNGSIERNPIVTKDVERNIAAVWKRDQATQRYALTPLTSGTLRQAINDFRDGHADVTRDIHVTSGEFLASTGDYFIAMQVARRPGGDFADGTGVTLFGEVIADSTSKPAMTFEVKRTFHSSKDQLVADVAIKLPPGSYTATVGVALNGTARAMSSLTVTANPIDPKAFGVSRLILSDNIYPLTTPQGPTEPFAFGGLKVVPRGDLPFASDSEIWLFLELRNPGVDERATPGVRARVVLDGPAGATARKRAIPVADLTPIPLKGFPGHFGLGIPLDASTLSPGADSVTVELTDTILGRSWSAGEHFSVAGKAN